MDKVIINNIWKNKNNWSVINYDKTLIELSNYSDSLFYFFIREFSTILDRIGETQANNPMYYKEIEKFKKLLDIKSL